MRADMMSRICCSRAAPGCMLKRYAPSFPKSLTMPSTLQQTKALKEGVKHDAQAEVERHDVTRRFTKELMLALRTGCNLPCG